MTATVSTKGFNGQSFFDEVAKFQQELIDIEAAYLAEGQAAEEDCYVRFRDAFLRSRELCQAVTEQLKDSPKQLAELQKKFRDQLAPWFDQSWFFDRAKRKPRGYPGDFVMLTALYDEENKSEGIGRIMDRYFLQADLAQAVRTRLAAVKEFVIQEARSRDGKLSVLNVASGPGREYSGEFAEVADKVTLTCIDSDEEALLHLKEHMDPAVAEKLDYQCVNYNALKTRDSEKNRQNFGAVDLIYSVGLCDYIPDGIMIRILRGWRESVAEGGIVYVAFKDSLTYVASEYQWHADWHFYQRTEEDCLNLFREAGYDVENMEISRDASGIIINFVSRIGVLGDKRSDGTHELRGPHFDLGSSNQVSEDSKGSNQIGT